MNYELENAISRGKDICSKRGVKAYPYGNAWWLVGNGVNRVVRDLAGLSMNDIEPLPTFER
ncbi:MAG: hypothetical protein RIR18_2311 [Pseudomonadota bacterium]|jgi:hypothetical protein